MKLSKLNFSRVLICSILLFFASNIKGQTSVPVSDPGEVYDILGSRSFIVSIDDLMKQFKKDTASLVDKTNKTVVTGYTQSKNLASSFKSYTLKSIEAAANDGKISFHTVPCLECLGLRVEMIKGDVHVKKGITNIEELDKILNKYSTKSYTEINLSYVGSLLILQITVFNGFDNTILFSKKYKTRVYSLKEEGLIFGLSGLATSFNDREDLAGSYGGRLYLGHRMPSIGEVGIYLSLLSVGESSTLMKNAGMFFDLDLNDMFESYWSLGILYFTNNLGVSLYKTATHPHYSAGFKLSIFTLYHLFLNYKFNFKVGGGKEKFEDILIKGSDPIPPSLSFGFGFDFG
jgi:hypothetical protein